MGSMSLDVFAHTCAVAGGANMQRERRQNEGGGFIRPCIIGDLKYPYCSLHSLERSASR